MVGSSILSNTEERAWERGYILPNRQLSQLLSLFLKLSLSASSSVSNNEWEGLKQIVLHFNFCLMPSEIVSYVKFRVRKWGFISPSWICVCDIIMTSLPFPLGSEGACSETAWEQAAVSYYIFFMYPFEFCIAPTWGFSFQIFSSSSSCHIFCRFGDSDSHLSKGVIDFKTLPTVTSKHEQLLYNLRYQPPVAPVKKYVRTQKKI